MKAVIMAGGEGTRLRPLTCGRPKPMVSVANKPVMEHILELLKKYSFNDVAVTLQYMPDLIREHFDDGSEYGINMKYYIENMPLGTAGSIKNAEDFLDDTFLVISGDSLTDIDLKKAVEFHKKRGSIATLILKKVDIPLEYGVVVTDDDGRIMRFVEKPSWGEVFSETVNTGIYILSPEVLKYFKKDETFDFSKDLFPIILKEKEPMFGYITDEYWCDIGDLNSYMQAHFDIMNGKVRLNIPGRLLAEGIWAGEGTEIDDAAGIKGPCIIGKNCKLKKGSYIDSYSVIGDNNIIERGAVIKRSITWRNCRIDRNVQLRGCIICSKVHLKNDASAFENSVIGDDTVVCENAIIKPDIKIWPNKLIEQGTEVNSNIVWGSNCTKAIFGSRGISGEINVDITPEYSSRLGAAFGSLMKSGGRIGISCDDSNTAGMAKISLISGLLSAGMEVFDFGKMLLPVARTAVRFYRMNGGIHVSTSSENSSTLLIDFLNDNGSNIERNIERKVENAFLREDFIRCEGECIRGVREVSGYSDFYLLGVINSVKSGRMKYRISLHAGSDFILNIMKKLFAELGCEVRLCNLPLINAKKRIDAGNCDLGVIIDDTSEKLLLVDEKGRVINEDMFIALTSLILLKSTNGGTVVIPISASHAVEKIASENNGKVIRAKTSRRDLMSKILSREKKDKDFEQFDMNFDAISGLVKILDFMNLNGLSLANLIDMIPEIHISRKEVECPWNAKGKVIRKIIQENNENNIETLEGVKVYHDKGWVLVLPDAEKPICRVISESATAEFADELTNIYINKVRDISSN